MSAIEDFMEGRPVYSPTGKRLKYSEYIKLEKSGGKFRSRTRYDLGSLFDSGYEEMILREMQSNILRSMRYLYDSGEFMCEVRVEVDRA